MADIANWFDLKSIINYLGLDRAFFSVSIFQGILVFFGISLPFRIYFWPFAIALVFLLSTNASFRRAQIRRSAYLRHASYNIFSNTRDEVSKSFSVRDRLSAKVTYCRNMRIIRDLSPPCFTLLRVSAPRVSCYNSVDVPLVCLTSSSYYAEVTQSISTYVNGNTLRTSTHRVSSA